MAKIIIRRKSSMVGSMQDHDVYLFNTYVGELRNGGMLEIPVDVGNNLLTFKSKLTKLGIDATFNAVVNEKDEVVELKTRFVATMNSKGEYRVEYADNKPHIPMYPAADENTPNTTQHTAASQVENPTATPIDKKPVTQTTTLRCSRCGGHDLTPITETTTTGKNFKAGDACCGYLLCGPLGLLCGATGKGKQTTSTTYWLCRNCGNKFKA